MNIITKSLIVTTIFFLTFLQSRHVYPQSNRVEICKTYDELYNTIKKGISASIEKTSYINEFSIIEKSTVVIIPLTAPDSGYKVTYKIEDLAKGKKKYSYDEGSVLGFMVSGCKNFGKKYADFINTSCWFIADNPEEARNAAESGITFIIDQKYIIEGDLVSVYEKTCKQNDIHHEPVKKPAVYLYPLETSNISVKVEVNGQLTFTEPLYNNGWYVNVTPDGLINNRYDYLFYEADLNKIELPDEGWIVEFKNLEKWFDEYLPKLGLNTKEKDQFKEYWLKNLKKSMFYEIKLLDNNFLKENMNLVISPEPQTLIRLNFYFTPLFEKIDIKEPMINTPERRGFTVVEWGGINAGDSKLSQ